MKIYKAYIGRSSYEIPYDDSEDLQCLIDICKSANLLVNHILSQDRMFTNEYALALGLINLLYESKNTDNKKEHTLTQSDESSFSNEDHQDDLNQNEKLYTSSDIISLISYMKQKLA